MRHDNIANSCAGTYWWPSNPRKRLREPETSRHICLDIFYCGGKLVSYDDVKTRKHALVAGEGGGGFAPYLLGVMHLEGHGDLVDSEQGIYGLTRGETENTDRLAQYHLERVYYRDPNGVPKYHRRARRCFCEAALQGDDRSQLCCAHTCFHRFGGRISYVEARKWGERAVKQKCVVG